MIDLVTCLRLGGDSIGMDAAEAIEQLTTEVSNLKLANEEARKTIDRLSGLIPREPNDGFSP